MADHNPDRSHPTELNPHTQKMDQSVFCVYRHPVCVSVVVQVGGGTELKGQIHTWGFSEQPSKWNRSTQIAYTLCMIACVCVCVYRTNRNIV